MVLLLALVEAVAALWYQGRAGEGREEVGAMASDYRLRCAGCGVLACKRGPEQREPPDYCPMVHRADLLAAVRAAYGQPGEDRRLAQAAARTEAAGYCRDTRVEEVMALARRLEVEHLGLACCVGLLREAARAQVIFEAGGFRVSTVACKVGAIPKSDLGLTRREQVRDDDFEALCNPMAQARLLDDAGCGLHVLIGLCVGHDSLYFRHARAPVTVLVAKDRVTGHNPAAVLYNARSYYRRLLEDR
jgi:uncharacterized metal-binding protein